MTDETVRITCPSCGTAGKVRASDVGKAVICQNCKQRISVSHHRHLSRREVPQDD